MTESLPDPVLREVCLRLDEMGSVLEEVSRSGMGCESGELYCELGRLGAAETSGRALAMCEGGGAACGRAAELLLSRLELGVYCQRGNWPDAPVVCAAAQLFTIPDAFRLLRHLGCSF